jgi:4-oxalocrotonate tautomerase family enzyme
VPTITVTSVEGHTEDQIDAFLRGVTRLAVETLGAAEEGVIVHFHVLPAARYMRGGKTIAERRRSNAR